MANVEAVTAKTDGMAPWGVEAAAWRMLAAQLDRTTSVAGSWDAAQAFGLLGPRRWANACRYLARERQRLAMELQRLGLAGLLGPRPDAEAPGLVWAADGRLPAEFAALAQAYERCAQVADCLARAELALWLASRARIHHEHALLLAG
jgi:hypothetical protein